MIISSNIENINIGELPLDPFWRKAEALGMPVLIHPVLVGPAPRAAKFGLAQVVQYTFDTTLGIGSVLMSGVLDRFPGLKLVLSHGGGAYPYLAGRFDIMHRRMDRTAQGDVATKLPSAYATQMTYDSIVHAPKALRFLIDWSGLIMWCWGLIIRSRRPIWSRSRCCERPDCRQPRSMRSPMRIRAVSSRV